MHRHTNRSAATFPDFGDVVQTTRERLRIDVTHREIEGITLYRTHFSAGFQFRAGVPEGRAVLAFAEGQCALVEHGRPWPPGAFMLASSGGIDTFSLFGACLVWIEFAPGKVDMSQVSRAALASDRSDFVAGDERRASRLRRAADGAYDDLPAALGAVLGDTRRLAIRATVARRYQLVLDAEEYVTSHFSDIPLLEELGAELGCSPRTLIYAFTQVFGIGPMAYFKLQRLHAIHRRLTNGEGALKLSELAPLYGFHHMGHFSTDYRLMFGRPPSQSRSKGH